MNIGKHLKDIENSTRPHNYFKVLVFSHLATNLSNRNTCLETLDILYKKIIENQGPRTSTFN